MNSPEAKKRYGCVGKGCIVMMILAGFLLGMGVWGVKKFMAMIATHASSAPLEAPVEAGSQDEYASLLKKLDTFKNAAEGGANTLELTAQDLNLLITFSPEWEAARGKAHATIEKDQIGLTGSLPIYFLASPGDQYLNGEIYFTLSMDDKGFHVSVRSIKLKSGNLSGEEEKILSNYWTVNLINNVLPAFGPVLVKMKTLKVTDGKIVLTSG